MITCSIRPKWRMSESRHFESITISSLLDSVEEDGETWGPVEVIGGDEDMLYLGAEAGLMCVSESLVTSSVTTTGAARLSRADASVTASVTIAGAATSTASQPASAISVTEDAAASLMGGRLHHPPSSFYQPSQIDGATAVFTRPLTLTDVEITLQEQQADKMGVEGRRSQFASLREKQSSFQSELSGLSFHSKSSIDSLLESRQADPVEVLLSLGFGGHAQDGISRIPERFLRPSQVPGNDIDEFMRSEDEISEMMETAEMMPGIDPQALRRSSVATVSPLMTQLLDNFRESRTRLMHGNSSDELPRTPPAPAQPTGIKRFAAVAKKTAVKSAVMNTLAAVGRSVLNPENRRLLDLQGQKSPEVPRKRLIIGQASFDLDRDGQLLNDEDDLDGPDVMLDPQEVEEEDEPDSKDEEDQEDDDEQSYRPHKPLQHKDSVWSMASSATSVESSEEELRDRRRSLQLLLTRHPPPSEAPETPTTPGDSLDSPQPLGGTADSAERRRKLLKRLGSSKRISTVSSNSSREVDELIPEEELEDDGGKEPSHHQIISEADVPVHSSSDPGNSLHFNTPQQFTQNLSSEMHTQNSVYITQATRSALDTGQNILVHVPSHSAFHPLQPLLHCSSCTLDPTAHHTDMFSASTVVMDNCSESVRSHLINRPIVIGDPRNVPNHRGACSLRRQQCVDETCADVRCQSPPTLHLPWPHLQQHHPHTLTADQARGGGHDGSQDEGGRLGAIGPLCRSGSAQSDSSGFMEGDTGEGETRGPAVHPLPLSSVQHSSTSSHPTGHGWWWSRDTGCSMDTIRHMPLGRTKALRPGFSPQGQTNLRTISLDQTTTHRDHGSGTQGGRVLGLVPPHGCRDHNLSHHTGHTLTVGPVASGLASNCHPHFHHAHSLDCSSSSHSHNSHPTPVNPSHSLDNSAFHAYHVKPPVEHAPKVIANGQHTPACTQYFTSYPEPGNSLHNSYHPSDTWCRQHTSQWQQPSSSKHKVRQRRHSFPERLPPSLAPEVRQPRHTVTQQHQISQSVPSQLQPPRQLAQSSLLPDPYQPSQGHWHAVSSEYLFPPTNSNSLANNHFSSGEGRKLEDTITDQRVNQTCEPQSLSHELTNTLQSYRQQLLHQEQLSHQLYRIAADTATSPVTSQQVSLQLHNIRAIRAAIRAEVSHMEQLMAGAKPNSLSQSCVSRVVAQMVLLLQQQSELCRDLETLTLASRQPSPEPSDYCANSQDPTVSHSHPPSQSDLLENPSAHQNPLRDSSVSLGEVKHSSTSLGSENNNSVLLDTYTNMSAIPELSKHNSDNPGTSSYNVKVQDKNVPIKLEELSSTVPGAQKPCDNANTSSSFGSSNYFSLEKDGYYRRSVSQESSSYSSDPKSLPQNNHQIQDTTRRQEAEREKREPVSCTTSASGAVDADSSLSSDVNGQVAQLVRQEVLGQTEALQQQLHKQTTDVADIKTMMQLLLSKLK